MRVLHGSVKLLPSVSEVALPWYVLEKVFFSGWGHSVNELTVINAPTRLVMWLIMFIVKTNILSNVKVEYVWLIEGQHPSIDILHF